MVEIQNGNPINTIKGVFLSKHAFVFYIALIAMVLVNVITNKILRDKQKELLNKFSCDTSTYNASHDSNSNKHASENNVNIAIVSCGPNKIQAIKYVREFVGLGLADAQKVAEGEVGIQLPYEKGEMLIEKLKNIGADAQIVG